MAYIGLSRNQTWDLGEK